ncbi:MAG: hypothetical protein K1564_07140 [Candidatus Thiodiazotropha sp. (ex. Lucinisca nassula)]|nr:hypothetical protein [Candidatus Thiodiazotropha sp. (ex. Lucinisca nassula)]
MASRSKHQCHWSTTRVPTPSMRCSALFRPPGTGGKKDSGFDAPDELDALEGWIADPMLAA